MDPVEIEQTYLKIILEWLDTRLEGEVRRFQLAGQDPSDRFRGLRISDADALELSRRAPGTTWSTGMALPQDDEKRLQFIQAEALNKMKTFEAHADELGMTIRLKSLIPIFGLTDFEWWAFIICLAPSLDLRYERIYGYLQDDVTLTLASTNLILNLLLPEGLTRLEFLSKFEQPAPLRVFHLLIPIKEQTDKSLNGLRQTFQVAPAVLSWLLGAYSPTMLNVRAELYPYAAESPMDTSLLSDKIPSLEILSSVKPFLSMDGEDLLQQDLAARQLAALVKRPLLKVN
jgi:hypothetical protein